MESGDVTLAPSAPTDGDTWPRWWMSHVNIERRRFVAVCRLRGSCSSPCAALTIYMQNTLLALVEFAQKAINKIAKESDVH